MLCTGYQTSRKLKMNLILKFFAGIWGKIAIAGAVLLAIAGWFWNVKRKAREQGRREVVDDLNKQGEEVREKMKAADKPKDIPDVEDDLRSGRF